jgi:hypothetical protein
MAEKVGRIRIRRLDSTNGRTASRKRDRKWQSARTLESWVPVSSVRWNALEELLQFTAASQFIAKPVSRSSGSQLRPKPRNAIPAATRSSSIPGTSERKGSRCWSRSVRAQGRLAISKQVLFDLRQLLSLSRGCCNRNTILTSG